MVGSGLAEAWLLTDSGLAVAHPRGAAQTDAALLADLTLCQLARQTEGSGIQVVHSRANEIETYSLCRVLEHWLQSFRGHQHRMLSS